MCPNPHSFVFELGLNGRGAWSQRDELHNYYCEFFHDLGRGGWQFVWDVMGRIQDYLN